MSRMIRLIDRTRTTTDWRCPRARYWNYEYNGIGLVKNGTSLPLFLGTVLHDGLAAIASFHDRGFAPIDIDSIAEAAFHQIYDNILEASKGVIEAEAINFANEQASLVEGLLRGYYLHVWPRLLTQYPTIIAIEKEVEYKLDDTTIFMAKPDLIMTDEAGDWHYIEFKSTSSKKEDWINSWETAVQLHSSIKAVEQTLGQAPVDVTIVGLYKGWVSYGKQSSPLVYCYKKSGNPPFTEDQIQYEFKAGFRRVPTWELPGGVKAWVEGMPPEILANQFPMTPPIYVNEDLVDSFFKQRLIRERQITESVMYGEPVVDIDKVFPQKFDACTPSFGWPCEFKKLCFGNVQDPLSEGFQFRQPHHLREIEALNETKS